MTVQIIPSRAHGAATAPPSKSMAHRALIAAAMAGGTSTIENVSPSEDLLATIDCLRAFGAQINYGSNTAVVTGMCLADTPDGAILRCRESGTTLRLLIPLALTSGKVLYFTGSERLLSRPLSVYEDICRSQNHRFDRGEEHLTVQGVLSSGVYSIPGDVSSQFISGLCFALPLLDGDSRLEILPPVESRPYIEMTARVLEYFGISITFRGNHILIPGRQHYTPANQRVEGDWSNAAFLDALNMLGGNVTISGLSHDCSQGDQIYPRLFAALSSGTPELDLSDCPDLAPICFAMAAAINGATFTGVRRLRLKESDRISAMAEELSKFGVKPLISDNAVMIPGGHLHKPNAPLFGHNDHRVVMALAVLLTQTGGAIAGVEAVSKSFPGFFEILHQLGIEQIQNP